ncbi:hypothetical protein GCM10027059_25810 [Myceligenerans halotolerans]
MADIPSTPADGNIKTVLVPAIADITAPTVAELTAVTAVEISCYLTPGGYAFQIEQATITDERECDTITRAKPGRKTPTLQITGIDNTNSASPDNELADALTEGSHWFAARRRGKAFDDAFAAADVVAITEFDVGVNSEVAADANTVLRSLWNTFVEAHEPAAVVAA